MKNDRIVVGISAGDINGIGYEVILKTLLDARIMTNTIPVVYGSPKVAAYHRKALNIENFSLITIKSLEEVSTKKPNIVNCLNDDIVVELGKSTAISGEAAFISLQTAVKDLKSKKLDVIITAPINKKNIQSDKFNFPGHTEYLQKEFECNDVLMLMVSEIMKIGVVIGHQPINKVAELITTDKILSKLKILNNSLKVDFKISKPLIAVFGLNPHAGDDGVIGNEEKEIIIPAIKKAQDEGIMAYGPFPADGFFASGMFKKYDAILAMYHDQGLAPFKALCSDDGVNYTAGLPIVRTSPAHGTAYEIAGKGIASEESFRQAYYLACDIFKNRTEYYNLKENAMKNYDISQIG
jgi:4-hydroxythreonine-4-phosphate dehydrogenase